MNTQIINKILRSKAGLGALILRVPLGIILIAHGSQKLFGLFGGYGLQGTGQFMESIGFAPGYLMALLAGSGEFFGGLALVLGLLTRPAAIVTAFTMFMAMTVHIGNGLFVSNNGYEYALLLAIASVALIAQGAGTFSIDNKLANRLEKSS
ncbi:DoxX family protein [Psychromonas sp. KJ10-10]|uniref:DoxX family protein n=1 Tax=Psychromonas sp. KJ10-10 TaxID=3391823 RepID=UPI0039B5AA25